MIAIDELLTQAVAANLTIQPDGALLRVRGERSQEDLIRRILAAKHDVLSALATGRDAIEMLRRAGHQVIVVDPGRLRVTPPLPPDRRDAVLAHKPAVIAVLWSAMSHEERAACGPGSAPMASPVPTGDFLVPAQELEPWPPIWHFPITWDAEYHDERAIIQQRILRCTDPEIRAVLRGLLSVPAPSTEQEWLVLGHDWQAVEHELRRQGRLPDYYWPARDLAPTSPGQSESQTQSKQSPSHKTERAPSPPSQQTWIDCLMIRDVEMDTGNRWRITARAPSGNTVRWSTCAYRTFESAKQALSQGRYELALAGVYSDHVPFAPEPVDGKPDVKSAILPMTSDKTQVQPVESARAA